ncbi:MAG: ACP S-malonyltransferase [Pseudomonadota bacterium]
MKKAFVFPGQGSQFVGMGKEIYDAFPVAREVFEEVDSALSQNLSKIIFEGPESDLNLTENTQPALMAVSLAITRVLETEGGIDFENDDSILMAAGHSLGEYSALTAMKALTLADTARLLKIRGTAMQKAVPVGVGAMAAILGLDYTDIVAIAADVSKDGQICAAANDNANGQVVISGHKDAVEAAIELASERGARKSVLLPVSAPFHCALMAPAADRMREALAEVEIKAPVVPVIANMTAREVLVPEEIRELLVEQVTGMVRWRESVLYMKERGVEQLVEVGAGKVLSGLTKRIDRALPAVSIQTPADIEAFLKG